MKTLDYLLPLKQIAKVNKDWLVIQLIVEGLVNIHEDKIIQRAILKQYGLLVDGIIGRVTVSKLMRCNPKKLRDDLIEEIIKQQSVQEKKLKLEDKILPYLGKAEGMHFHWNKTEKDFTTPYGIYAYAFPNSKVIRWVRKRARELGITRLRKNNLRKFEKLLTRQDWVILREMILEFYLENFLDKRVMNALGDYSKTQLSVFSNGVNGGKRRGNKSIQSAVGAKVDGKIGSKTIKAIKRKRTELSDDELNQKVGNYMYNFYISLVKRKSKMRIYLNGWINRLKGLGWRK